MYLKLQLPTHTDIMRNNFSLPLVVKNKSKTNHSLANIYLNYLHNTELAAVNLVEGPNFLDVSKWDIKSNDTISNGLLTINGQPGTRKPISCEGETLVVGETYTARVQVAYRTTGNTIFN